MQRHLPRYRWAHFVDLVTAVRATSFRPDCGGVKMADVTMGRLQKRDTH